MLVNRLSIRQAVTVVKNTAKARPFGATARVFDKPTETCKACEKLTVAEDEKLQMKRFWKNVDVSKSEESYNVLLDGRKLKTPSGQPLSVKSYPLSLMVASEWHTMEKVMRPSSLPITSTVARAQDSFVDEKTRTDAIEMLLKYLDTDSICYHSTFPEKLVELQDEHWKPIVNWAQDRFGVKVNTTDGILGIKQPKETREKLQQIVTEFSPMKLAAFERATMQSKSFLIGLALVEGHTSVDDAADAARVEVKSQIDKWGEVQDTHDVDAQDMRRILGAAAVCAHFDQ